MKSLLINNPFLLLLTAPLLATAQPAWHELGRGIGFEALRDEAGTSVASSSNGLVVAVGSPIHDVNGSIKHSGRVRVYNYQPDHDGWKKKGQDLVGDQYDQAGSSVGLSDDGSIVAVGSKLHSSDDKSQRGCVRIYQFDQNSNWMQLGQTIVGDDAFELFGSSLAIEGDGEALIVGAPHSSTNGVESGKAYVYVYIESAKEWQLVGEPIEGVEQSRLGTSVSISDDGFTIAVGAPKHGEKRSGQVQVYHYEESTSKWEREAEFLGNYDGDECGTSVGLNPIPATYLAIGCPLHNKNQNPANYHSGRVIIKKRDTADSDWSDGGSLDGDNANDEFGYALSIGFNVNNSQPFLAVGSPKHTADVSDDSSGSNELPRAGRVRVFHFIEDAWEGVGLDVYGETAYDLFGSAVSIGNDGKRIIAGAPGEDGYATIFELKETAPPTFAPTASPTFSPTMGQRKKGGKDKGSEKSNGNDRIEEKRSFSVWVVFFIALIAIGLVFGIYKVAAYMRNRRSFSSTGREVEFTPVAATASVSSTRGADLI